MVDELDKILERRRAPEPPSNLAERIIERSKQEKSQERFDLDAWLGSFFRNFLMPQPAVAMAIVLFAGVMLGSYVEDAYAIGTTEQEILYAEENLGIEELL